MSWMKRGHETLGGRNWRCHCSLHDSNDKKSSNGMGKTVRRKHRVNLRQKERKGKDEHVPCRGDGAACLPLRAPGTKAEDEEEEETARI